MKLLKKSTKPCIIATLTLITGSNLQAQNKNSFLNGVFTEFSRDGMTGIYIVGGIASFAFLLFIITQIVQKYMTKEKQINNKKRQTKHRPHHKPVKKSQ